MSQPFVGEIKIHACSFAPRGWQFCQGQLIPIQQNTALFSLLGTQFGGNGQTTFGLPDLRGRTPIHKGTGPGLTQHLMGEMSGTENVTLLATEMPMHTHATVTTAVLPCSNIPGNTDSPAGNFPAANENSENFSSTAEVNAAMGGLVVSQSLASTGNGQAHSNMPPYLVLNFCIATQGVFPSRN
jgi:microcystin-dependent protein